MDKLKMITQQQVKELFDYKDGELYWKKPLKTAQCNYTVGDKAGKKHSAGYIQVCLKRKLYLAHRLIFLWHHGYLPKVIDHIDGNKCNNRIENIREVTSSQNGFNCKLSAKNLSGYKNVYRLNNKWGIAISVNGKNKYFGTYDDVHEAGAKAKELRNKLRGEYARHE